MNNFFLLSNVDYDYEEKFFLEGPEAMTEEQFNALCTSLVPEAGRQALEEAKPVKHYDSGEEYQDMVNPTQIMQTLVKLLEQRGFKQFRPKACHISGSYIGGMEDYKRDTQRYDPETPAEAEKPENIQYQLKDVLLPICEHNEKEYERMNAKRKILRHPAE